MLLWNTAIYDRDYRAALSALDDWQADALEDQWAYRPRAWFYGVTHALAGDADDAKKYFSEAQATLQTELERRPSEPRRMIALADTLACQGDTERALELVARARSLFPTSLDAAAAPNVHRITSYNVCYTKLLRSATAKARAALEANTPETKA